MTMTSIVLFGPPGSGKSSTIDWLSRNGWSAFDMEAIPAEFRQRAASAVNGSVRFIGAANLQPSDFPNSIHLLLLPGRAEYRLRRAARDAKRPHKADQPDVYQSFAEHADDYDAVVSQLVDLEPMR